MKILFIADILPDSTSGSAVRNYYLLKALAKNNEVDFIGLTDDIHTVNRQVYKELSITNYTILQRRRVPFLLKVLYLCTGKIPYIEIRREILLPKHIIANLKEYDVVHLSELNSYFVIEKYQKDREIPLVLDAHNVEYIRFSSEIQHEGLFTKQIGFFLARRLKRIEIKAVQKMKHLFVCSIVDKNYFKKYILAHTISVIPNGVNIAYYSEKIKERLQKKNVILFMGLLSYFPNSEGLQYYLSKIHPIIQQKLPEVTLHILGKDAPAWLQEKSVKDTSIQLLGFVPDTRQAISEAAVCIAPLLSGSGTRLKILEYMAMKKAIVSTAKGAEGITVEDSKNILIAKNAADFSKQVLILLNDKRLRETLGNTAYMLVKEKYDWKSIGTEFTELYETIVD